MARPGDVAGLAALGALGYLMSQKQDGSKVPVTDYSQPSTPAPSTQAPAAPMDDESQWGTQTAGQQAYANAVNRPQTAQRPVQAPARVRPMSPADAQALTASYPGQGRPSQPVYPSQGRAATGPITYNQGARYGADAIPGQSVQAPQGGQRADSTELGRNVTNALGAMGAAGRLAGIGNMATEAATAGRVQRAYNAQQEARRAAEGLSPAEVAAFKKKLAEASFEGGMKKGGKVKPKAKAKPVHKPKKMASGGMTSRPNASKRADGIATKGHTKCKMR